MVMRKIIFCLLLVVSVFMSDLCYGQDSGKTVTLGSYEGEWKWEDDDECLILYLRDTTWQYSDLSESTDIIGTYKYIKNGVVVVDNTNVSPSSLRSLLDMPIHACKGPLDNNGNIFYLRLSFTDTVTGKESSHNTSTLSYTIGRNGPELFISLKSERKWYEGAEDELARTPEEAAEMKRRSNAAKLPGWSIPNNVTLTKVN